MPNWTEEEMQLLIDNDTLNTREIASLLGRSYAAVQIKAERMGIIVNEKLRRRVWTQKEFEFVKQHSDLSAEELGKKLNRSPGAVQAIKTKLGVTISSNKPIIGRSKKLGVVKFDSMQQAINEGFDSWCYLRRALANPGYEYAGYTWSYR